MTTHDNDEQVMPMEFLHSKPAANPEVALQWKEAVEKLAEAINRLDEPMRTAVIERDILGCTYEELAEMHGLSVGTLHNQVTRGRRSIRHYLADTYGLDFQALLPE